MCDVRNVLILFYVIDGLITPRICHDAINYFLFYRCLGFGWTIFTF